MKFLGLHKANGGLIYVNVAQVRSIEEGVGGGTVLTYPDGQYEVVVEAMSVVLQGIWAP